MIIAHIEKRTAFSVTIFYLSHETSTQKYKLLELFIQKIYYFKIFIILRYFFLNIECLCLTRKYNVRGNFKKLDTRLHAGIAFLQLTVRARTRTHTVICVSHMLAPRGSHVLAKRAARPHKRSRQ